MSARVSAKRTRDGTEPRPIPEDPEEGTRVDTGRNDTQTRSRIRRTRGDVFMDGDNTPGEEVEPRMPPENVSALSARDKQKFRDNLKLEIERSKEFIKTYDKILHLGPDYVKPNSDYETNVRKAIQDKEEDIPDFFNEDERIVNNRNI